ncbi:RluA family pseudouridine synthase [Candidatus Sulfurimonas marisnigri]|uniref:RNA pseudouridylate synthase n=1 Tax=Candidatus Sulfurimonas marisnigri TaxID=2740405 RepID=A0A7S7RQI8_9BACT|nr:RluA family pseudouridine synthase [Candidatus Sulfurimonas marisnigri]QOY54659.1 RluA family pseudouridine synthase [Candidatus Sulfurimonas marisnigri]
MPFILKKMFIKEKQRAFLFIVKELGYTQKEAQRFISKGRVLVNGEIMDKSSTEIEGEIEFICFEPISKGLQVHVEYDEFVVFDKPSGLLIHPQNRNTPYSLIDELKYQFGRDANIAHRIDQETSGLVLCSKNKNSERDIKMMFQERDMKKKYLAMVHGEVKNDICIEAPLLRKQDESAIVRMVVKVHEDGKKSKTDVKPLKYFPDKDMTLVECSPFTGRQHQIRVHLFHVKHSIVGDPIYGQSEENIVKFLDKELTPLQRISNSGASRLLLHANELEFDLYNKKFHINSEVDFFKICFDSMSI